MLQLLALSFFPETLSESQKCKREILPVTPTSNVEEYRKNLHIGIRNVLDIYLRDNYWFIKFMLPYEKDTS